VNKKRNASFDWQILFYRIQHNEQDTVVDEGYSHVKRLRTEFRENENNRVEK
jgi:hypothetical protein